MKTYIIHYSEIALKKGNRAFFEKQLINNIKLALADFSGVHIRWDYGRFFLELPDQYTIEEIYNRLKDIIGIAYFSVAYSGDLNVEILKQQIYDKLKHEAFNTFKIFTKRADKRYPLTSVQVNQIVGEQIHTAMKKPADLMNPDLTCTIEIYNNKIIFYYNRSAAIRGLPVGSSGRVVSLLSSGIDSPVASFQMMTRGCKVTFVHFHSFPFTEKTSYYNAINLTKQLTRFQYKSRLHLVPLVKIQEAIIESAPPKFRLILYRRMMFRIAEMIAKKERAKALITGESLGQVASQTLENISVISEVASLPVLRPLIGADKEFIIEKAKSIGTFTTSIEPYDDCCSFLVPRNPETRAKITEVLQVENTIQNWQQLLQDAIKDTELKIIKFPSIE